MALQAGARRNASAAWRSGVTMRRYAQLAAQLAWQREQGMGAGAAEAGEALAEFTHSVDCLSAARRLEQGANRPNFLRMSCRGLRVSVVFSLVPGWAYQIDI